MVSYWSFDKVTITGKTVKDLWGKNDGNIVGSPKTVTGKIGDGLELTGSDYIEISDKLLPTGQNPRTILAWVNFKGDKTNEPTVCYGTDAAGQRFDLHQRTDGIGIAFNGHFWGTNTIMSGWTNLAVVIPDKMAQTDGAQVYINGERLTEKTVAGAPLAFAGTVLSGSAWLGKNFTGPFTGVIDDIFVYDRALTKDEIRQDYTAKGIAVSSIAAHDKIASLWGKIKTL